jgi:phosphoglycolate phosphatase
MHNDFSLAAVLFDLDGTLLNTAPDLITALNKSLLNFGFSSVKSHEIIPFISYGASAMIEKSLPSDTDASTKNKILDWLINYYENHIADFTQPYEGILTVLENLEQHGIPWGIVSNKRERLAIPLMKALNLSERAACLICGDTTAHSKPHPEPMFEACLQIGVPANQCIYIADAQHDITAGNDANMKTLVATYGFLKSTDTPENWGADILIDHPLEILDWIKTYTHVFK